MKTISIIAVSTLLGSAVSGQMIAPGIADPGSDFQQIAQDIQDIAQDIPKLTNPQELPSMQPQNQTIPRGPVPNGHPAPKGHPATKEHPAPNGIQNPPPVVHVTKTKTQIIYPTPNEQRWKDLPALPHYEHGGKVVAEFYLDDKGHFRHFREMNRGHHQGWKYANGHHKVAIDGMYPHGKVIYGGPWVGPRPDGSSSHYNGGGSGGGGGYRYKGSHDGGQQNYHRHDNGHEEHRKENHHHEGQSHHNDKQKHDKNDHHYNSNNRNDTKHDLDGQSGKKKNDWKKKTADGYQAKGIEGIVAQNNASAPMEIPASGSAMGVSASMSVHPSESANAGAQKTPAAGSASAMPASSAKNAAATSSPASNGSSQSSKLNSSAASSTPASSASNTRQVTLSFVAAVAATAIWCLA